MRSPEGLVCAGLLALLGSAASALSQSKAPDALTEVVARGDSVAAVRLARERATIEEAAGGDPVARAERLLALAERVQDLPGPEVAAFVLAQLVRSLELREQAEGRGRIEHLKTLQKLSEAYFGAGRWELSEEMDRRCLAIQIAARGPFDPGVAETQRNLSLSLFNQGKLRAAEALLREAVTTLDGLPDTRPLQLAYAVSDLADNLRAQGRYREATPLFERSVALAEGAVGPSSPELVTLLINLGGLYRDTNRYGESAWRLGQALQIAQGSKDVTPSERVSLWNNLAELHRYQGDLVEAERLYKVAIDAARESLGEDHPRLATYQNQLGELLSDEGRLDEAEPYLRGALARRIRILGEHHLDVAYTYRCLGQLLTRQGHLDQAEDSLRRALAIQEERLGPRHPDVGMTVLAWAEALAGSATRPAEAVALADRAVAVLEATPAEPRAQAAAWALRATLAQRAHEPERARADLARALTLLEGLRPEAGGGEHTRARSFARFLGEFQRMVEWQVQAGDVAKAFEYAERARGRALMDQLAASGVDLRSGIEPMERQRLEAREAEVQSRLAECRERLRSLQADGAPGAGVGNEVLELTRQLAAASADFQAVYEEIKNASRFWRTARPGAGGTVALEQVQKELVPSGSRMLFYVIGDRESFVFDVPPWGAAATVHRLLVDPEAARELGMDAGALDARRLRLALAPDEGEGLLGRLSSPPPRGLRRRHVEAALHGLWRVLVPPRLWPDLRRSNAVVVVPDGLLHQIPFEALVPALGTGETASRYWLDEGPAVRYAASATALLQLSRSAHGAPDPRPSRSRIVSVSDPAFGGAPTSSGRVLERLPGTARESAAIQAAFAGARGGTRVEVLQGAQAREASVRAALPGARYIHLATHGQVDESHDGLFATLALSPPLRPKGASDDGQLQLYEIYTLALRSELAVLSSCESRVGRVVAGEGVFALSRAFLAAGSRRVVASLWPAEDDSTALIVSLFFRTIALAEARDRKTDFAAALLQAKRAARARSAWSDPFFWGPFVLEGIP